MVHDFNIIIVQILVDQMSGFCPQGIATLILYTGLLSITYRRNFPNDKISLHLNVMFKLTSQLVQKETLRKHFKSEHNLI